MQLNGERARSVAELTAAIKALVEIEFDDVRVTGEVVQFRPSSAGHWYFDLKDDQARIGCVVWRSRTLGVEPPENGREVEVHGRIDVYPPQGKYQLIVDRVVPRLNVGRLMEQFEALRGRLMAEGLLDAERKKPLPMLPSIVGIATAETGAALADMLRVLKARMPTVRIVVAPCLVQGDEAPASIARALARLDAYPGMDVIICGRGGGSLLDLWAYNTEVVARAIVACRTPVVSAVGHESDTTIADLVADLRAATPTHAAQLVVPVRDDLLQHIDTLAGRLEQAVRADIDRRRMRVEVRRADLATRSPERRLRADRERLVRAERTAGERIYALLRERRERLTVLERRLAGARMTNRLDAARQGLITASLLLERAVGRRIQSAASAVEAAVARLGALDPEAVLARGYAIVTLPDGRFLRDAAEAPAGTSLTVQPARGRLHAVVTEDPAASL